MLRAFFIKERLGMRLDKSLANSGYGSRKEVKAVVKAGLSWLTANRPKM